MPAINERRLPRDILRSFVLWRVWVFLGVRDVRSRFRRSFFGPLWILINSAVFVAAVGGVYSLLFNQVPSIFLPSLMAGFVVWAFIASTLVEGGHTFIGAEGYIKQFAYPKQVYILRNWISHVIIIATGLSALLVLLLYFHQLSWLALIYVVPGLALLFVAGLLHTLISAYLTVRFRDLPHVFSSIMQILFYVTPVIFPAEMLDARGFSFVYQANPFYHLINIVRAPLLHQSFANSYSYTFVAGYLASLLGVAYIVMRRCDAKVVFWL